MRQFIRAAFARFVDSGQGERVVQLFTPDATFERRGMSVPDAVPIGLTDEFAHDSSRQSLWLAFLKKNELLPEPLPAIVDRLRSALAPALNQAAL